MTKTRKQIQEQIYLDLIKETLIINEAGFLNKIKNFVGLENDKESKNNREKLQKELEYQVDKNKFANFHIRVFILEFLIKGKKFNLNGVDQLLKRIEEDKKFLLPNYQELKDYLENLKLNSSNYRFSFDPEIEIEKIYEIFNKIFNEEIKKEYYLYQKLM